MSLISSWIRYVVWTVSVGRGAAAKDVRTRPADGVPIRGGGRRFEQFFQGGAREPALHQVSNGVVHGEHVIVHILVRRNENGALLHSPVEFKLWQHVGQHVAQAEAGGPKRNGRVRRQPERRHRLVCDTEGNFRPRRELGDHVLQLRLAELDGNDLPQGRFDGDLAAGGRRPRSGGHGTDAEQRGDLLLYVPRLADDQRAGAAEPNGARTARPTDGIPRFGRDLLRESRLNLVEKSVYRSGVPAAASGPGQRKGIHPRDQFDLGLLRRRHQDRVVADRIGEVLMLQERAEALVEFHAVNPLGDRIVRRNVLLGQRSVAKDDLDAVLGRDTVQGLLERRVLEFQFRRPRQGPRHVAGCRPRFGRRFLCGGGFLAKPGRRQNASHEHCGDDSRQQTPVGPTRHAIVHSESPLA